MKHIILLLKVMWELKYTFLKGYVIVAALSIMAQSKRPYPILFYQALLITIALLILLLLFNHKRVATYIKNRQLKGDKSSFKKLF